MARGRADRAGEAMGPSSLARVRPVARALGVGLIMIVNSADVDDLQRQIV